MIEQRHDSDAWMMWHGAALTRSIEKLPKLGTFLSGKKKKVKGIDEAAIMQRLKNHNKQIQNGDSSKT